MGLEVIDFIVNRTEKGIDKNGEKFPKYSASYVNSNDFKNAGKSKGKVNLTLSKEMLNSIELLSEKSGELVVGFDKGDKELNGKAEGNIVGSYGGEPDPKKARDFLGIADKDLDRIVKRYEDNKRAKKILRTE